MEIKVLKTINHTIDRLITGLYSECIAVDPVSVTPLATLKEIDGVMTVVLYEDNRLAAYLSSYEIDDESIEIQAFTHPDCRQRGFFKALFEEWKKNYAPERRKHITFQCDERSAAVRGFIEHNGCILEDTEYMLVCDNPKDHIDNDLEHPDPRILEFEVIGCGDLELLAKVHAHVFDQSLEESQDFLNDIKVIPDIRYQLILYHKIPAGIFFLRPSLKSTYLFGLGIIPELQGKGYSDIVMRNVFRNLPVFCTQVCVQVGKDNERALHVYQKNGFEIKEALSIYHFPEE